VDNQNQPDREQPAPKPTSAPIEATPQAPPPSQPATSSAPQPKVISIWVLIILFFIFPPVALFIAFKHKTHHKLLPIFLWIYSCLMLVIFGNIAFSILPKLRELYNSANTPYPGTTNFVVWSFIAFLIIEIIFGAIVNKILKTAGILSKKLLLLSLLFFVIDMIAPAFIVFGVISPIYSLVSNVGEMKSNNKNVLVTPTPDPTADWKTYTNNKYGYSISYPTENYARVYCINANTQPNDNVNFSLWNKKISSEIKDPTNVCPLDTYSLLISLVELESKLDNRYSIKTEYILIDGESAVKKTAEFIGDCNEPLICKQWQINISTTHKDQDYFIYFYDKENEALFDQILSTLKFTE
jgi:hypothetical protein